MVVSLLMIFFSIYLLEYPNELKNQEENPQS